MNDLDDGMFEEDEEAGAPTPPDDVGETHHQHKSITLAYQPTNASATSSDFASKN